MSRDHRKKKRFAYVRTVQTYRTYNGLKKILQVLLFEKPLTSKNDMEKTWIHSKEWLNKMEYNYRQTSESSFCCCGKEHT